MRLWWRGDGSRSARRASGWRPRRRLVLGGVFVVAGALKLPDPAAAVRAVRAYRLLPEAAGRAGRVRAAGRRDRRRARAAARGLRRGRRRSPPPCCSSCSSPRVGSAWARGLQIDCGCFGNGGQVAAGQTAYPAEIARDVGLLIVALALARWPRPGSPSASATPTPRRSCSVPADKCKRAAAQRADRRARAAEALPAPRAERRRRDVVGGVVAAVLVVDRRRRRDRRADAPHLDVGHRRHSGAHDRQRQRHRRRLGDRAGHGGPVRGPPVPQLQGVRGRERAAPWPSSSRPAPCRRTTTRWRSSTRPRTTSTRRGRSTPRPPSSTRPARRLPEVPRPALREPAPGDGQRADRRPADRLRRTRPARPAPTVDAEIKDLTYGDWVKKVTDQASKDGVTGTPTVLVKGKVLADLSPAGLTAAVNAAKG